MAQVILRDLKQMQADKLIEIEQAATLRRDAGTGLHLIDDAPAGDNGLGHGDRRDHWGHPQSADRTAG